MLEITYALEATPERILTKVFSPADRVSVAVGEDAPVIILGGVG